ncbi:adenylate/guanylate cyclase domain-containing protein [candidate division WOR-3 bacterium]|nr:adenylate/guanylate cyclase domain-containing protein [candidate division WOR-3 bacterium]
MTKRKIIQKTFFPLVTGLFWALSVFLAFEAGFFSRLEFFTSDARRKLFLFSSGKPNEDIVFFFIDQNSLDIMAAEGVYWPWPRKMTADLIDYLSAGGAKAVILDVLYTEPSVFGPEDDSSLAHSAAISGKVIVAFMASKNENFFSDSSNLNLKSINILLKDTDMHFPSYTFSQPPHKIISESVFMPGGVNIKSDNDGIYRNSPLLYHINGNYYPQISLAAYYLIEGADSQVISGNTLTLYEKDTERSIPLSREGEAIVNFRGCMYETYKNYTVAAILKSASFYNSGGINSLYSEYNNYLGLFDEYSKIRQKVYEGLDPGIEFVLFNEHLNSIYGFEYDSVEQMLEEIDEGVIASIKENEFSSVEQAISNFEKNYISPNTFKDKIIFIAGSAPGLFDIRPNPFNAGDGGVFIHASILDNLLSDSFLRTRYDKYLILALIVFMSFAGSYSGSNLKIQKSALIFLSLISLYTLTVSAFYVFGKTFIDFSSVPAALILSYVTGTLIGFFREAREKNFVRNAFGFYLSNKVVNELLSHPEKLKLGGERKFMTAFFSDIAGFTSISETMPPEQVASLLNEYLSSMCAVISHHDGIVDKFEGDAIIAFWGAPLDIEDHAQKACSCAIEMQAKLLSLRNKWEKEGKPKMNMRVGLNTGFMVVGNFGSDKRMDYTIIGDAVNLASRLEGVNKFYGTNTMISHTTNEIVENDFETRKVDLIKVKGKTEPIGIYELLGKKNSLDRKFQSALETYRQGLDMYFSGNFGDSARLFENVLSSFPDDGPSKVLAVRSEEYIKNPPANGWTGIFELTEK